MRISDCEEQPNQPFRGEGESDYRKGEDILVEFDVKYRIKCLGVDRNTSYKIKDKPDVKERQSSQPDYLVEDCSTGKLISIEYARFFESEEVRKREATLVKKLDRQYNSGVAVVFPIRFPSSEKLGKRLSEFICDKLTKGQFEDFSHTERILLARNRWGGVRIHRFIEAEPYFKLQKLVKCDHFYLIVDRKLLEVF